MQLIWKTSVLDHNCHRWVLSHTYKPIMCTVWYPSRHAYILIKFNKEMVSITDFTMSLVCFGEYNVIPKWHGWVNAPPVLTLHLWRYSQVFLPMVCCHLPNVIIGLCEYGIKSWRVKTLILYFDCPLSIYKYLNCYYVGLHCMRLGVRSRPWACTQRNLVIKLIWAKNLVRQNTQSDCKGASRAHQISWSPSERLHPWRS